METQQPLGSDIQTHLIRRAATDGDFRNQLLSDGRAALEEELGVELPADLEIQVAEETPTKLCLVLPMEQEAQRALAEEDLESVVGGSLPVPIPGPTYPTSPTTTASTLPEPIPGPTLVYSYNRLTTFVRG